MKRSSFLALAVVLFCRVAGAQPDLKNTPKGDNPPNRNKAVNAEANANKIKGLKADLAARTEKRIEARVERLPKMLTALGVTDPKTQDAIAAHFTMILKAREPLLEAQQILRRSLLIKATTDAQIKAASTAQRAARKDYEAAFQKALDDLDKKTSYSKNARLEGVLLTIGALDPDGVSAM